MILPQLGHVDQETDTQVTNKAVQLLVEVGLSCQTNRCHDVIYVLKRVSYQQVSQLNVIHTLKRVNRLNSKVMHGGQTTNLHFKSSQYDFSNETASGHKIRYMYA